MTTYIWNVTSRPTPKSRNFPGFRTWVLHNTSSQLLYSNLRCFRAPCHKRRKFSVFHSLSCFSPLNFQSPEIFFWPPPLILMNPKNFFYFSFILDDDEKTKMKGKKKLQEVYGGDEKWMPNWVIQFNWVVKAFSRRRREASSGKKWKITIESSWKSLFCLVGE